MQTQIAETFSRTEFGQQADQILRTCVHCGFCNATCPTYQILGDELDGPRGRIYLIKQMLEGHQASHKTQLHLDRCLTCRNCETTCPSGVQYHRLLDIGRDLSEQQTRRPWYQRLQRSLLLKLLPYPNRVAPLLRLAQTLRPLLPGMFKQKIPERVKSLVWPPLRHSRRMLVLDGCVQPLATPNTNTAAAQVLDALGISLVSVTEQACCGAMSLHLAQREQAQDFMRRNIDAWWPHIESGAEAIVMTASGCGVMVKDYAEQLRHDPAYAAKAQRVSGLTYDLSEVLLREDLQPLRAHLVPRKIAYHPPCTLQHGQQLSGVVETILTRLGFDLTEVADAHLCCGSAGTYSLLQPRLSQQLLGNKLAALSRGEPELIVSANIGCQLHLASRAQVPVKHWIELLAETLPQ